MSKKYKLMDANRNIYLSESKGEYGGYNGKDKIYGKLDCPSALKWISKGYYVNHRVFFANEHDAIMAGFRPRAVCEKQKYLEYKNNPNTFKEVFMRNYENSLQNEQER